MVRLSDIYKSVSTLLKEEFQYKIYGNEVREGYTTPSFFIEFLPRELNVVSKNLRWNSYELVITYFCEEFNTIDQLETTDRIREIFGAGFNVLDRYTHVTGFDYNYAGQDDDVLQISIDFEFYDSLDNQDDGEMATSIEITKEMRT